MNQPVPFVPSSHDESDGGDAAGAGDIESVSAGSDVADTSAPDSTPSEAHALAADEPAPSTQEISASEIEYSAPRPTGLAAAVAPPSIPLAPAKRVQAKFNPLADGMLYLVVFVGGFFGTAIRYGLSLLLPNPAAPSGLLHSFHTATFIANMLACFIFAALSTYMSQAAWIRKRIRQLVSRGVGMGMCGGFSTLSAMMIEDLNSLRAENIVGFVTYTLLSFICGLIIAWLGTMLGLALSRKREAHVVLARCASRRPPALRPEQTWLLTVRPVRNRLRAAYKTCQYPTNNTFRRSNRIRSPRKFRSGLILKPGRCADMFALICMCGGLGAVTRFVLNTSIQRWWNRAFPLSTFIINVLATFFAGVAAAAYFYQTADHSSYLLFVTGFLGGFSTFSTAINEMVSLARSGKYAAAAVYFMMTVLVPVVCVVLGWGLIALVR